MPREMIDAYAILKKAGRLVNQADGRLEEANAADLIVRPATRSSPASTATCFRCTSG